MPERRTRLAGWAVPWLLSATMACAPGSVSSVDQRERPHVLLVMLDSCRADRIGTLGAERPTTPRIDALAAEAESVVFEWHVAQAPHTKASTASLMSGLYPFQHGVMVDDLLSEVELSSGRYRGRVLAEGVETLAEAFAALGYDTFADPAIGHLASDQGFAQGFATFLEPDPRTTDVEHVRRTVEHLASATGPSFAYLHLRACHSPWPPAKRNREFAASFPPPVGDAELAARGLDLSRADVKVRLRTSQVVPTGDEIAAIRAVYDSVLRHVDERLVGGLVQQLRDRGLYDRTLLVLSADHGEELLEHGGFAHGHAVWNPVVRVPLIIKFPRDGRPVTLPPRVTALSQTVDLYPSLIAYVGGKAREGLSGRDLFAGTPARRIAFTQAPGSWALFELPWKVVVEESGTVRLFDVVADLAEQEDRSEAEREIAGRLVELGRTLQQVLPLVSPSTNLREMHFDRERIEELRSLGYLQ